MEEIALLKPEKNFSTTDVTFAFGMLVCGFLFWNLIELSMLGAGVAVFAVVIFAVSCVYLTISANKQNKESLAFLILAGLSAAQFVIFDNRIIDNERKVKQNIPV